MLLIVTFVNIRNIGKIVDRICISMHHFLSCYTAVHILETYPCYTEKFQELKLYDELPHQSLEIIITLVLKTSRPQQSLSTDVRYCSKRGWLTRKAIDTPSWARKDANEEIDTNGVGRGVHCKLSVLVLGNAKQ